MILKKNKRNNDTKDPKLTNRPKRIDHRRSRIVNLFHYIRPLN